MAETDLTKSKLTDLALAEFLKNGIQSFTILGLTEIAGISSKTVYKLFGDKSGLLRACIQKHYTQMLEELLILAKSASNEVEGLLETLYRVTELEFEVNPKFYTDLNKYYPALQDQLNGSSQHILAYFIAHIDSGMKNGFFIPSLNKEASFLTIQHLYAGITRDRIYAGLELPSAVLISNSVFIFIRGMCTPLGLQKLEQYQSTKL